MKIRTGFVSNSSSSSFCIYGIVMSSVDVGRKLWENAKKDPKLKEKLREVVKDFSGPAANNDEGLKEWLEEGDYDLYQVVETLTGLEASDGGSEGDSLYIGWGWQTIKDDETGKQFKKKVEDLIEQYFGNYKCGTYMEAWYN